MCFETVLILAYLSGRTLVMPRNYRRHQEPEWEAGEFKPLHPRECFEFERLDPFVKVLSHEDYCRMVGGRETDTIDLSFEPGTAVFCFPAAPHSDTPASRRLRDFAVGRTRVLELTPPLQACQTLRVTSGALEHFYTFFFLDPEDDLRCKRLVRDHLKFHREILAVSSRIAAYLGSYGAMHVRRNDFIRQFTEQDHPADRIFRNLAARMPERSRLYIATDEKDKGFFAPIRERYDVCFIHDLARMIPGDFPAGWLACVEQMICAFAEIFLGTRLSTFSAYITRLRGYYGAHDQEIYFTDGSPGSELDDEGSPPFSWINWVRGGHPLWGREFREAWRLSSGDAVARPSGAAGRAPG
jgi:hypothetical protein